MISERREQGAVSTCSSKMMTNTESKHLVYDEPFVYAPPPVCLTGKADNMSNYGEPVRARMPLYTLGERNKTSYRYQLGRIITSEQQKEHWIMIKERELARVK